MTHQLNIWTHLHIIKQSKKMSTDSGCTNPHQLVIITLSTQNSAAASTCSKMFQMWTLWCTIEMQPMWTRALSSQTWGWRSAPHPGCISLSSPPLQCTLEMTDRWSLMDDIIEKQQRWHPNATTLDTLQNLHCALMLGAWILHTGGADKKPCQSLMPN